MVKKTRYLFLIFALLIVALACVAPAGVTTPDPNFIDTAIAQTQTAAPGIPITGLSLTPTLTKPASATPFPTFTVVVIGIPQLSVSVDTICRSGPGDVYDRLGVLRVGEVVEVVGRSADGNFWVIRNPDVAGETCWISDQNATLTGLTGIVPVFAVPPTPTPTNTRPPSFTSTPTRTRVPTSTPQRTPTPTSPFTPTFTPTSSIPTASPTIAPTFSPTATATLTTSTPTTSSTSTSTPSPTPTSTLTASSPTASPTSTSTFSPTPTSTLTASSPTASPTATPTLSPTPTTTLTSSTPTTSPTSTSTPSPTPTFSPTPTPSFTPTSTPSQTSTPSPTPTLSPGFIASFSKLESCTSTGWWVDLALENTGGLTYESILGHVSDTVTGAALTINSQDFTNRDGCSTTDTQANMPPGVTRIVSLPPFVYNPTGHPLSVSIILCPGVGQSGTCLERVINFTP